MKPLYTVSRITKTGKAFGHVHGSDDGCKTVCGKELNPNWAIRTNNFIGIITCKACLRGPYETTS